MQPQSADPVLASPARLRIYEVIRRRPGISMSELAREVGAFWTSAGIHVARLESAGLVRSLRVGRRRVLVSADLPELHLPFPAVLSEPACRVVALAIARNPGLRVWELGELTHMSDRAVYHHVKRLADTGLIESIRPSGYRGLTATPELLAWLSREHTRD